MVNCSVDGCKSSNQDNDRIFFHRFPRNTAEALKWQKFCNRPNWVYNKNTSICSLHFTTDDYRRNLKHELLNPGIPDPRPKLKNGAIPSIDVPYETSECEPEPGSSSPPALLRTIKQEFPTSTFDIVNAPPDKIDKDNSDGIHSGNSENISDLVGIDNSPFVCLICDKVMQDSSSVGVNNLYLDSSLTSHTHQQLVVMLAVTLNIPLNSEQAYSKSLCRRCFNLVEELDEVQHRSKVIQSQLGSLYSQSFKRRNPNSEAVYIREDYYETSFLDGTCSIEDKAVSSGWKKRKAKQKLIEPEAPSLIDMDDVLSNIKTTQDVSGTHVIKLTHTTGTTQRSDNATEMETNPPKITIKVFQNKSDGNTGVEICQDTLNPKPKRNYRKRRTDIVHLCKFCMKVFSTGKKLRHHQRTHSTIECKFCGKILVRIGAWENHLKTFHNVEIKSDGDNGREMFSCDKCDKQFTSKSTLRYHSKLHDGTVYKCTKCDKEFNHPGTFKNHKLVHQEKKFMCDKCGKGFRTNFHLIMHDNQTHRRARSWQCKYCQKAFARCSTFKIHLHTHKTKKTHDKGKKTDESSSETDKTSQSLDNSKADSIIKKQNLSECKVEPITINVDPQSFAGDELLNEDCNMLDLGREIVTEEATSDQEESVRQQENPVLKPETELYGDAYVISDEAHYLAL